jgi:EpsI family protein
VDSACGALPGSRDSAYGLLKEIQLEPSMHPAGSPFSFLQSRPAQVLTAVLVLLALVYYGKAQTTEITPLTKPLSEFPARAGSWQLVQEGVVEKEVQDVLRADDLLTRQYASPGSPLAASLFVAYFRSQRSGKAPHSPKNCLPGSGWTESESAIIDVPIPGGASLNVNRYLVSKGQSRSLVIYWYQSKNRAIASEFQAKAYLVWDALRYNRSDTALVRVVLPVREGNEKEAEEAALDFVRALQPHVQTYFPS